ncbi:MAG: flagellar brake domain-containing protein [Lysinibacillus sp.]
MDIKIGTQLRLEPTYTERIEKYKCKVVEQKDNVIYIDYPINEFTKKTAFLIDGAQFRASFQTDDKESYVFPTEVTGRQAGNIPMILLSCPEDEEFIKIQRREYVRVETPVDIAVTFNEMSYQLVAEDISAGGLALHLKGDVAFGDGDTIQLLIVLPFSNGEIEYVATEAMVIRIFERDGTKIASIQLTDTDEIDQQHILRFCFERQLIIRKKEVSIIKKEN